MNGDKIYFKKLHKDAIIPKYQTPGASGFDFHTVEKVRIAPGETVVIKTGLAYELPQLPPYSGPLPNMLWELQIRPRGGTSLKTSLRIANSPGTCDNDYRGEIGIISTNIGTEPLEIPAGERIAQGVIALVAQCEIMVAEKISDTARGTGAYGSTGK